MFFLWTLLLLTARPETHQEQLTKEGFYAIYGKAGARTEMPGCSLCMGNQAGDFEGSEAKDDSWEIRLIRLKISSIDMLITHIFFLVKVLTRNHR